MPPHRESRNSRKHLASDYEWERIDGLLANVSSGNNDLFRLLTPPTATGRSEQGIQPFPSTASGSATKDSKSLSSVPGAIPKATKPPTIKPAEIPSLERPQPTGIHADDTTRLALLNKSNELEIKNLELQLELAKLGQHVALQNNKATSVDDLGKSMGDVKAPQKTRFPQRWPHIFAQGEPKLYSDLTLAEFCAGYIAILQQHPDNQEALLSHFHDLMILASSYKWSAVCSFHYKVLRSIELGLMKWGDSFEPFKQTFFLPTALLPAPVPCPTTGKQQPKPLISSSSIPHGDICNAWSWYKDCTNTACSKLHICVVCKRSDHRAVNCPKQKFPVLTRRTDPPPRD